MDALAFVRPDDWNFPLFLHVLGAMVMVGALVLALGYLAAAWRGDSPGSLRLGFRVLLYGAVPSFLVMRLAGQWIYSKEGLDDLPTDPSWINIGFSIGDIGLLFLVIATVVAGRRRPARDRGRGRREHGRRQRARRRGLHGPAVGRLPRRHLGDDHEAALAGLGKRRSAERQCVYLISCSRVRSAGDVDGEDGLSAALGVELELGHLGLDRREVLGHQHVRVVTGGDLNLRVQAEDP